MNTGSKVKDNELQASESRRVGDGGVPRGVWSNRVSFQQRPVPSGEPR